VLISRLLRSRWKRLTDVSRRVRKAIFRRIEADPHRRYAGRSGDSMNKTAARLDRTIQNADRRNAIFPRDSRKAWWKVFFFFFFFCFFVFFFFFFFFCFFMAVGMFRAMSFSNRGLGEIWTSKCRRNKGARWLKWLADGDDRGGAKGLKGEPASKPKSSPGNRARPFLRHRRIGQRREKPGEGRVIVNLFLFSFVLFLFLLFCITERGAQTRARPPGSLQRFPELKRRSPPIQGFTESSRGAIDDPQNSHPLLEIILEHSLRLARLTRRTCSSSKWMRQAGSGDPTPERFPIRRELHRNQQRPTPKRISVFPSTCRSA